MLDAEMKEISRGYHLLKRKDIPMNAWDKGAFEKHGISYHKSIKEGESPVYVLTEIREKMLASKYLVSHNFRFDMGAIDATFDLFSMQKIRKNSICTMALSNKIWPKESKGLKPTWERIYRQKFDQKFRHHNALDDALAAADLLKFFKEKGYIK
jgi:DNA polymerase III epsilon subunit-like protein